MSSRNVSIEAATVEEKQGRFGSYVEVTVPGFGTQECALSGTETVHVHRDGNHPLTRAVKRAGYRVVGGGHQ